MKDNSKVESNYISLAGLALPSPYHHHTLSTSSLACLILFLSFPPFFLSLSSFTHSLPSLTLTSPPPPSFSLLLSFSLSLTTLKTTVNQGPCFRASTGKGFVSIIGDNKSIDNHDFFFPYVLFSNC